MPAPLTPETLTRVLAALGPDEVAERALIAMSRLQREALAREAPKT